jgi:hypothetical protein
MHFFSIEPTFISKVFDLLFLNVKFEVGTSAPKVDIFYQAEIIAV